MIELNITIIGAGLSGLASAIALSRAGHKVTILEKSQFKKDAGFMITFGASANLVLERLGLDWRRARATDCDFMNTYDGQTLVHKASWSCRGYLGGENDQVRSMYRPDLHDELKRIALLKSESGEWKTPVLRLGAEVKFVDIHTATVHLVDGSSLEADLVIGADGERPKSLLRTFFPNTDPLVRAPIRNLCAIIPTETLLDGGEMQRVYESTKSNFSVFVGQGHKVITYFEARDGLLQDLECSYPPGEGDLGPERDSEKAKRKVLDKFADFHPAIVNTLQKASRVSDWELWHGTGVWTMHEGRALLVGDAAHSMLPFTGQGGGQGIEDAGALFVLFANIESKDEVFQRCKLLEDVRRERTAIVQSLAGVTIGLEEKFARENEGHLIHKTNIRGQASHFEYMFNYDVFAESEKALRESGGVNGHS